MFSRTSRTLTGELSRAGLDVRDDRLSRSLYSSDASLYRVSPRVIAFPRNAEDVQHAVRVAAGRGVPVTARGAGTSVAGNAIGPGLILDFSRHMNRVLDIDPAGRIARVQPGTVHATVQTAASRHGLRFGPDPSTHTRCTIGGMIGNNACGSRSLAYGRTSDNVRALTLVLADGERMRTGYDGTGRATVDGGGERVRRLQAAVARHLDVARLEFGRFPRQVSGYAVQHMVPEAFDLTQGLVGSEGTLGIVTEADIRLVRDPAVRVVVALGFATIVDAAAAAPGTLQFQPTACEGLDARIVEVAARKGGARPSVELPRGAAWLFVELSGSTIGEVVDRARALARSGLSAHSRVITDVQEQRALWRIREDGAGLAGRSPSGRPAWPGWEDAAVPAHALADYLRGFDELTAEHGLTCAPFGHFGEGCVHVRMDYDVSQRSGARRMRAFLEDASRLVAKHGGSLSGEHGDGRARSALLREMYSPRAVDLITNVKRAFDENSVLNPGVIVDPAPVDSDVRLVSVEPVRTGLAFLYPHDDGDLSRSVHRCTGVGRCRADNTGGVMCPSYLATREEKDSTRGRARVLQDVVAGHLDWNAPAVGEALDLCLSCKGCASDCPTGIDMATFKSEALHQRYRRRIRPRTHYTLGWLPALVPIMSRMPRLYNALMGFGTIRRTLLRLAGIDSRRSLPMLPRRTFRATAADLALPGEQSSTATSRRVLVFVDTFTDSFSPQILAAAVRILRQAGYEPFIEQRRTCCGLTWIATGQLSHAKKLLAATTDQLQSHVDAGALIVGLEPSCTAVLRKDSVELLGTTAAVRVAAATRTLAELLTDARAEGRWAQQPDLGGVAVTAQPHCHHYAVLDWTKDGELLRSLGADVTQVSGCCGLAGSFGMERSHYDISVSVARQHLLPAVAAAAGDAVTLADGFSCRTQLDDLCGTRALHLAELLDSRPDAALAADREPER